jgi:DNA-binding CsgD family transcriptional regulator
VEYGSSSLLEREAELSLGDSLLDRALAGDGGLLLVAGEPGIGKTRLLAAVRRRAETLGFAVLAARGSELERELGFGVVRQLFEAALARAPERADLLAGAAALAEPLIGPGALPPSADPGFAALHGLYWLTANLAARRPLLIAVDDAHWADAPSLRFLAYLAGRLAGVPALAAVATRLAEPAAETALLDALMAEPEAHVVRPQPLSREAVAALVAERLDAPADAELAAACSTATGGNPFLLAELLAALAADGLASAEDVRSLGPGTVRRSVLARVARLEAGSVELARAVAILGEGAELQHAAALAGLDVPSAARAADALVAADVFRRDPRPAFVHPLVQAAIYEDLLPHERAVAHARAARALASADAEPALIGAHLLHASPSGDEWPVEILRRAAAEALSRAAPESAAAYLQRALAEPPARPEHVLRELGAAELRTGNPRGLEHLALAQQQTEDPIARAAIALDLARASLIAGRGDGAALLEQAAVDVRPADPGLADRLEIEATGVERALGVAPEARRRRLQALREQVEPGSAAQRLVLAGLAFETATAGTSAAEAARLAEDAFAAGRLLAEEGPESPNVIMAANALSFCDRFEQARDILDAGLAAARAGGSATGAAFCSCFRSHLALRLGAVQEAEALARDALALARPPLHEILRPIAASFLAEALIERGEPAAAEAELAQAAAGGGDLNATYLLVTRGWLRVLRGARERGLADLLEAGERLAEAGVANAVPTFWRSRAALALHALGEDERAASLAAEEVTVARRFGAPSALGAALRAASLVTDDQALLRESADVLARSPARLEHAHSLAALGAALRRDGRSAEAREPLGAALALARECGALALAEHAYEELVATGARPRKILRTGADALTATERRVAQLAVDGMSNRDIAQALFVTVRTVETHLSHAYRKLGIGSRRELPAALAGSSGDDR